MKKIWLLAIGLIVLSASCYHENQPEVMPPEDLLSRDEMVEVLTDVYIVEGTLYYHRMKKELNEEISSRYYNQIFEEHHISHRILKDNLRYYNSKPEDMEDIIEDVLSNLSKFQAEILAMEDTTADTIPVSLNDSMQIYFIPSLLYQTEWSFASLIDSLLLMPIDSLSFGASDSLNSN